MSKPHIRPMRLDDWIPALTKITGPDGQPYAGFARADGQGGNPLFKALPDDTIEAQLLEKHSALRAAYPSLEIARHHVQMPYWSGARTPTLDDYTFVDSPHPLTTTAITVLLVPRHQIADARLGFHFQGTTLPTLRERLQATDFKGVVGNLGYFMTAGLINNKYRWSHTKRYPAYPLPKTLSYLGFHCRKDLRTGDVWGAFEGAHPSAVAIREDGSLEVLHDLGIERYTVRLGGHELQIDAINEPKATGANVVAFTPGLRTQEVEHYITKAERSQAANLDWQTYAPVIPLGDAAERIHIFIANQGDDDLPQEKVIAIWEGIAPLPSFGAVLSFKRTYFETFFGSVDAFSTNYRTKPVQVIPGGKLDFSGYQMMLGGLVPSVIDGQHLYHMATVSDVLHKLDRFGNALSPIAKAGRETQNFDPYVREPAGLLIQTQNYIGWVLFDGRHEFSIGASVVDSGLLLKKLEEAGCMAREIIHQALFVDGGSAMKIFEVASDRSQPRLEPLNRAAAGARNGPHLDFEGLNLYSTVTLKVRNSTGRRITFK